MALNFETFIDQLEGLGVVDVLLPFLLVFAIVYAVLMKTKLLGKDNKNINIIIALILGMSVVIPHVTNSYPPGSDVVDIMNVALPQVSLIAVAFVSLMILLGVFGTEWSGKSISGAVALVSAVAVFLIFGGAAGWWDSYWLYDIFGEEAISLFVMLIIFGIIVWFITKEPSSKGDTSDGFKKWMDVFAGKEGK